VRRGVENMFSNRQYRQSIGKVSALTNLFFQTFLKFDQQTFRKSLTKNAAQASHKKSLPNNFFTFGKNLD
jgi:hypothetical protein